MSYDVMCQYVNSKIFQFKFNKYCVGSCVTLVRLARFNWSANHCDAERWPARSELHRGRAAAASRSDVRPRARQPTTCVWSVPALQ